MTAVDRRQAYRRTRRTAVLVGCIGLLTFVATEPGGATADRAAAAPFSPGTGNAVALGYKVNPAFGGLSFGITAGESIAGHQNTAAQAQSKAVNLGVIGVTLAGEGCEGGDPDPGRGGPAPARDRRPPTTPGAAEGKSGDEAGAITMFSRATKTPFAESITTVAPVGEPALAVISGATTHATSGVVAPGVREAHAITEIGVAEAARRRRRPRRHALGGHAAHAAPRPRTAPPSRSAPLTIAGVKTPLPGDGVRAAAAPRRHPHRPRLPDHPARRSAGSRASSSSTR